MSYVFGTLDDFDVIKRTEMIDFRHGNNPIPVNFVNVNLQLYGIDDAETPYNWNMDVGYIDPFYQTHTRFDFHKENMLGLAPMKTDVEEERMGQFLYQFAKTGNHGMNLEESFAFNGGEYFTIGGNLTDYENLACGGGVKDELFESEV